MATAAEIIKLEHAQPPFFVGIDVGGTNIKVGLVDDLGRTLSHLSIPTRVERGAEDGAERMGQAVKQVVDTAQLSKHDIARVGLGTPGTMDIPAGMLLEPVNLKAWRNFPIRDRVAHHVGLPVTYANDAKAATYGEFWVGSGRNLHSMVLFTLGTGIGGGIIIGDLLIVGEHSHGAECGHIVIDYCDDARMCGCGHRGHLEAYASATAVIKRSHEALAAGRNSSLSGRLEAGAELTPLLIATEAEAGDALSLEIVLDTARYLGIGAVSMMHAIDPDAIVLGGAMTFGGHGTELGRRFLAAVKEEVQRRALPIPAAKTSIDFASLGGDAGYIGVAGLARLDYRRQ
ncbi:MAG TPA: ROK family protein [Pirellulales bacterium]|jgi:glucokinase|nr:ROK family protein [Pirellulales bacterium]